MADSHSHLFVYGTLLLPEIWEAVTGIPEESPKPARLPGHRIGRVRGGDFPVIALDRGAVEPVRGKLHLSISPETMKRLDDYEDGFYVREEVTVESEGTTCKAFVYRLPDERVDELFSDEPWSLEWFQDHAFATYWDRHFA